MRMAESIRNEKEHWSQAERYPSDNKPLLDAQNTATHCLISQSTAYDVASYSRTQQTDSYTR